MKIQLKRHRKERGFHKWFAWHPIVNDWNYNPPKLVWLEFVQRKWSGWDGWWYREVVD